jgi:DNA excision repair protein ERCC-3
LPPFARAHRGLILSRVGNFALDLPDADVLIQVSGKYGSRQEEAQRLGRVLRPKTDGRSAQFYTLVSLRTCEEEFAQHRQLFLTEQGYRYHMATGYRIKKRAIAIVAARVR